MARTVLYLSSHIYRFALSSIRQKPQARCISTADKGAAGAGVQSNAVVGGRWRRFWRSWVPIPTSVGFTVLAVLQWRRLQRGRSQDQEITIAKDWEITCYRAVPCRALSRVWGWISSRHVPGPLRSWVYRVYSSMYGVDLDEMAGDLHDYPSLAQFFTRQLKQGIRPIDTSNCIVSPADGRVLNCGRICSCQVEQVKGVTYKIQTFLGEPTWRPKSPGNPVSNIDNTISTFAKQIVKSGFQTTDENSNELVRSRQTDNWEEYKKELLTNPLNELYQAVVYLAPGDYHRFHSPINWKVNFRRHFQGELLSVNPRIAGWIPELFSLNERVVYVGEWQHGFFSMTAVGATNVGSIKVYSDNTLQTNTRKWRDGTRHRDRTMSTAWEKGEEVGEFQMGSTIVLIFEAPKDYQFNFGCSESIKVGQSLCCDTQATKRSLK